MSRRPGPLLVRVLRAPARLYDWRLGWVLGDRFLRLTHRGRVSGRQYRTMLEVVEHDETGGDYVVMVGLGQRSDWWRNLQAGGGVEVAVGNRRFRPEVRRLDPADAAAVLGRYEKAHPLLAPVVRRVLSRLGGMPYDGTPAARERLVAQLPLVALHPAP